MAALVGAIAVVSTWVSAAPAAASTPTPISISIPLGTTSVGRILVDAATSQVFVTSPVDNSIVVTDFSGNIKKTIVGEAGADAMVVLGSTLYVTLTTLGAIDRIDTGTLTETSRLVTGLFKPQDLAYAHGRLWTTTGQCGGTSAVQLAAIDPNAVTPTVTLYPSAFTIPNFLSYCALFVMNHAANPDSLTAWAPSFSPSWVTTFDLSGGTPVQVHSGNVSAFRDAVVTPDTTHFIAAGGCCGGAFPEYNLSDLTSDGTTYVGSVAGTLSVDATAANGGLMIGGSNGLYDIYQLGAPSAPIVSYSSTTSTFYATAQRSVAFAPDGLTAFAAAMQSDTQAVLDILPVPYVAPPGSPSPPTNVTADSGVGSATVGWTPGSPGASAITGFTITASTGSVVHVGPQYTSVTIAGLAPSVHTFTVSATNSYGTSAQSAPSPEVFVGDGGTYHPLSPSRILDTRNGTGGFPLHRVAAGTAINLQVTGRGGVAPSGVSAVVMNVTVTNPTGAGFVTAYPAGAPRPNASNLNYVAGLTVPNLVEVAVGDLGMVSLYAGGASTDLVADVEGWVGDATNSYGPAGTFAAISPVRILDTRTGMGAPQAKLGPGQSLLVQVTGVNGITPQPYLSAAVLNVTVTNPTAASYLSVYPSDVSRPTASNLNFSAGQTIANRVIVPLNADGQIRIFNGSGTVDVVADVSGLYASGAQPGGGGFVATVPQRLFDSRSCSCKLQPGTTLSLTWNRGPGFQDSVINAFVLNMTVTNTTGNGYLTVYPYVGTIGGGPPTASDINYRGGQTIANLTVTELIPNYEMFFVYAGGASTDVIIDVMGYYGSLPSGTSSVGQVVVQVTETGSYHAPRPLVPAVRIARTGASA